MLAIGDSISNIIRGGKDFVSGNPDDSIDEGKVKDMSDFLYNLFLGVGIIIAVIVGIILGIKYMTGSVEEKAEYKESLIAYAIGCLVIFGAFGIWRLTVNTLSIVGSGTAGGGF